MNRTKTILILLGVFFILIISGCGQLDNQPDGNQTQVEVQDMESSNLGFEIPENSPDSINGKIIFDENCSICHGEDGLSEPSAIGTKGSSFPTAPVLWYEIITNGRGAGSEMQSFADRLDLQSRWDVLAYVYYLSSSVNELKMGEAIFDDVCSTCHGAMGEGGSMNESHMTTDFTNLTLMSMFSSEYIFGVITPGIGNEVHVIEGLDDFSREAVSSYVRTFSFPYFEDIVTTEVNDEEVSGGEVSEEIIEEIEETPMIDIEGIVVNGVNGEGIADQVVTLVVLNHSSTDDTNEYEGLTNSDGEYSFSGIEIGSRAIYLVYANYEEVTYQSDYVSVEIEPEADAFTISVFEATTDLSNLVIETMDVFFVFHNSETILIQENWLFSNTGSKTILPVTDGVSLLTVNLPENVSNMGFSDYSTIQQMSLTETGFQIEQPFMPGADAGYLLFAYEVPYSNKYEWTRTLPVSVNIGSAYIPVDTISIRSSDATYIQERMFNNSPFEEYGFEQEDGVLSLTVRGRNPYSESLFNINQDLVNIIIGTAFFGAVLIGFIIFMRRTKRSDTGTELMSSEQIMDQIIALDDAFENGDIEKNEYKKERSALKELLQVTLENDQS